MRWRGQDSSPALFPSSADLGNKVLGFGRIIAAAPASHALAMLICVSCASLGREMLSFGKPVRANARGIADAYALASFLYLNNLIRALSARLPREARVVIVLECKP